jgi:AcrR family transcriptional regulator
MSEAPHETTRRRPVQGRSRSTVGFILEAAAQVFRDGGYGASTAEIARKAGVSVGSIYQYFPSKEALLVRAVRWRAGRTVARIARQLDQARLEGRSSSEAIREAVAETVLEHHRHRKLQLEGERRIPGIRARIHSELRPVYEPVVQATARLLEADPALSIADPQLTALFVVDTLHERCHWYVEHGPEHGIEPEAFAAEVSGLIGRYVAGVGEPPATQ